MTLEVVGKWDVSRIQTLAPEMDAPVVIMFYHSIPCSVHGSPLEKLNAPINGYMYREVFRRDGKPVVNYEYNRSSTGRVVRIDPETNVKQKAIRNQNRYLVAVSDVNGNIDPIVEVTNGGRCNLRCRQWGQLFGLPFNEAVDQLVLPMHQYKRFLARLSDRLVV